MIQGYRMAGPPPHGEPPEAPPAEREWPWWLGFVGLVAAFFAATIAGGFLYAFGSGGGDDAPAWVDLSAALILEVTLVATALVAAGLVKPPHAWQFGLRPTPIWRAIGWAALGLLVFYVVAAAWVALVGDPDQSTSEDIGADESNVALICAGLLFVVIAPIAEELFFRGFFYGSLRTRFSPVFAAVVCGVVFGAIHATTGISAVPVLIVLGIIFCLVREKTGSLYPCIAMHALNNSFAYIGQTEVHPAIALGLGGAMIGACCLVPRLAWRRQPLPA